MPVDVPLPCSTNVLFSLVRAPQLTNARSPAPQEQLRHRKPWLFTPLLASDPTAYSHIRVHRLLHPDGRSGLFIVRPLASLAHIEEFPLSARSARYQVGPGATGGPRPGDWGGGIAE